MTVRALLFVPLALALAGCFGGGSARESTPAAQRIVRVDWYGEQCFRVKSALGIALLTNPFAPGSTDFTPPKNLAPEIILISNERSDANYVDLVDNTPHILRGSVGVGTNTSSGVRFLGVPVFKDPETQDVGDMNVIYRWTMDGLRFCFLGQLATLPPPADLQRVGKVDILFVPASGNLTGAARQQIIEALQPRIIVPMGSASSVSRFASGYTSVYRLAGSAALLSRDSLPAVPTVLLFRAP